MRKFIIYSVSLLLLACSNNNIQLGNSFDALFDKDTIQQYTLNVGTIHINDTYQQADIKPYIHYEMPVSATQLFNEWAFKKFIAAGHEHILHIDLVKYEIIEEKQAVQRTSILDFTRQTEVVLRANWEVVLHITTPQKKAKSAIMASASLTLPTDISIFEREREIHRLSSILLYDINQQANQVMQQYFGNFILP